MAMAAGFSVSEMEGSFIRVKSIDDKLYPYHVRCTNNECQRSTAEKKREGMCSRAFCHVTQNILLSRQRQLFRASPKKQSPCFGSKSLQC